MNNTFYSPNDYRHYLEHHGVKGQKWGVRRYQNADGSYTSAGKSHYGLVGSIKAKMAEHRASSQAQKAARKVDSENLKRYRTLQEHANTKYDLANKEWRAKIEREANSRAMAKELGDDLPFGDVVRTQYGHANQKAYEKAKAEAEQYVKSEFLKRYGQKSYDSALRAEARQEAQVAGAMLAGSLGLLVIGSIYNAKNQ